MTKALKNPKEPSLPKQQLAILAICRFAEPVTATSINPYLPEMIQSFDIPIDQVAKYSGWLSACFSLSQCLTAIIWGRASDRLGRKPMILLALSLIMLSSVIFGFSSSIAMAFVARSIQGASSGNVGIIRTVVAEMVPQRELQPRAFSIMPLVWNVGSVFGPSIGGGLARPVERYPDIFGKGGWFERYPFALPNLVISVLFLVGITGGILFLKETHQDLKRKRDYGLVLGKVMIRPCLKRTGHKRVSSATSNSDRPLLDDDELDTSALRHNHTPPQPHRPKQKTNWKSVFTTQSNINLLTYAGLAMHSVAFDQILPVFLNYPSNTTLHTPVTPPFKFSGGFGLASPRIGLIFTIYGFFGMLVQFLVFPPVARKYGVLYCFKRCALTFPFVYALVPFTSLIDSEMGKQAVLVALMLVKSVVVIFAFPCSTILLTNSASSLQVLGTLNGVATSTSALGRAVGPALAGWAFSMGVDRGYIIVPFWVLSLISVLSAVPVFWLLEMEGFSSKNDEGEDGEDGDEEELDLDLELEAERRNGTIGLGMGGGGSGGVEEADLLNEDGMPFLSPTTSRPGVGTGKGRTRKDSYSLKRVGSLGERTGGSNIPHDGMTTGARRYSQSEDNAAVRSSTVTE